MNHRNVVGELFLFVIALTLVPSLAEAQQIRFRGFGGTNNLTVLNNARGQELLKLNDAQKAAAKAAQTEYNSAQQERTQGLREKLQGATQEERQRIFTELVQAAQKSLTEAVAKVEKTLSDDQKKRLEEIRIQLLGSRVVTDTAVQKALKMTAEQTKKVQSVMQEDRTKQRELFSKLQELGREGFTEKRNELTKKTNTALLAVVTDAQKSILEKLRGKKLSQEDRTALTRRVRRRRAI